MTYKILDLFCKAGGAGMGYHRAGFEVTGVDIEPQPRYPFTFVQADALDYVAQYGWQYDAIHASPPCQAHSTITRTAKTSENHLDLIPQTRFWLETLGIPYVIENVPGARRHLRNPIMLCGTMFNLMVQRHRYFETNWELVFAPAVCCHNLRVTKHGRPAIRGKEFAAVTGHFSDIEYARDAMGIEWMVGSELSQAIPPAYTKWIGEHLLKYLEHQL